MKKKSQAEWIVGIDEVGRGALAGPVVVVAAMVQCPVACFKCQDGTLRDSKQLTPKQREAWCAHFKKHPGISFAVARVYPRGIEKLNISQAANRAASRAYLKLVSGKSKTSRSISSVKIFLDGGLYLRDKKWQKTDHPNAQTLPKADETVPAVAIASILAKVHRDAYMCRLARRYPGYGLEAHKGYGTKAHYAALKKHGVSTVHRGTFLP